MKSIAYTLSVLLLGATFACADESKAPIEDVEVVEEVVEGSTPSETNASAKEEPTAPAKKQ